MSETANKVEFGLKNVHYAVITDTGTEVTYGTPVRIKGAVSMTAAPNGTVEEFEADDMVFYRSQGSNGYDLDFTFALLPDSFYQEVLGETVDMSNVRFENDADVVKNIAILGEINGDAHKRPFLFYNVTPQRPAFDAQTSRTRSPKTVSIKAAAVPHPYTGHIKAVATASTPQSLISGWYTEVYTKNAGSETV